VLVYGTSTFCVFPLMGPLNSTGLPSEMYDLLCVSFPITKAASCFSTGRLFFFSSSWAPPRAGSYSPTTYLLALSFSHSRDNFFLPGWPNGLPPLGPPTNKDQANPHCSGNLKVGSAPPSLPLCFVPPFFRQVFQVPPRHRFCFRKYNFQRIFGTQLNLFVVASLQG